MLRLTREFRFSLSAPGPAGPTEPVNSWLGWQAAGPAQFAPYLRLRVTLAGEPHAVTGYLCDIKVIDRTLARVCLPLAVEHSAGGGVTPARLLRQLWQRLPVEFGPGARLWELQLLPNPFQSYTLSGGHPDVTLYTEQFEFSAAHRLHCPEFSDQHNREVFGKCNNPAGHGHNYVVEVTVRGPAGGPEAAGLLHLAQVVKGQVIDRFDHRHLNEDTAEFRDLNPTVENIARVVWQLLAAGLAPLQLANVRVYETPKTWADYQG